MNEKLKSKLLATTSLVIGGCAALIMAALTQTSQTTLLLAQKIPCFLMLGQPEMPDSLRKMIKDREMDL